MFNTLFRLCLTSGRSSLGSSGERDHMAEEMRYLEISFKQRSPMHSEAKIFFEKLFWTWIMR